MFNFPIRLLEARGCFMEVNFVVNNDNYSVLRVKAEAGL